MLVTRAHESKRIKKQKLVRKKSFLPESLNFFRIIFILFVDAIIRNHPKLSNVLRLSYFLFSCNVVCTFRPGAKILAPFFGKLWPGDQREIFLWDRKSTGFDSARTQEERAKVHYLKIQLSFFKKNNFVIVKTKESVIPRRCNAWGVKFCNLTFNITTFSRLERRPASARPVLLQATLKGQNLFNFSL